MLAAFTFSKRAAKTAKPHACLHLPPQHKTPTVRGYFHMLHLHAGINRHIHSASPTPNMFLPASMGRPRRKRASALGHSRSPAGSQLVSEGTAYYADGGGGGGGGGGEDDKSGGGSGCPDPENQEDDATAPKLEKLNGGGEASTGGSGNNPTGGSTTSNEESDESDGGGDSAGDRSERDGDDEEPPRDDGEFTLVHLQPGGVFPPQSGLMMLGRSRKDKDDLDQARHELVVYRYTYTDLRRMYGHVCVALNAYWHFCFL